MYFYDCNYLKGDTVAVVIEENEEVDVFDAFDFLCKHIGFPADKYIDRGMEKYPDRWVFGLPCQDDREELESVGIHITDVKHKNNEQYIAFMCKYDYEELESEESVDGLVANIQDQGATPRLKEEARKKIANLSTFKEDESAYDDFDSVRVYVKWAIKKLEDALNGVFEED